MAILSDWRNSSATAVIVKAKGQLLVCPLKVHWKSLTKRQINRRKSIHKCVIIVLCDMGAFRMNTPKYRENCSFLHLGLTNYRQQYRNTIEQKGHDLTPIDWVGKSSKARLCRRFFSISEPAFLPSGYGTGSSPEWGSYELQSNKVGQITSLWLVVYTER